MTEFVSDVLILGSGPAGYSAGIYTARAGLLTVLLSGREKGGQLTLTEGVENFPGIEKIKGADLMENMRRQAESFGVQVIDDAASEVDFLNRPFILSSVNGNSFKAKSVIIATGSSAKWLDIASEKKFVGYGVSTCATCDGFFYKNEDVAVIGGGNAAAEEALYLTNFASKVFVVHRRDKLRADSVLQQRLLEHPKIEILFDTVVAEILGKDNPKGVTGLKVKNVKDDSLRELALKGVFIAIGHHPNTEIFKPYLKLTEDGYIITQPKSTQTNIEGIFACGDVANPNFRQAVIAAGSGAMAAMEAGRYLSQNA